MVACDMAAVTIFLLSVFTMITNPWLCIAAAAMHVLVVDFI